LPAENLSPKKVTDIREKDTPLAPPPNPNAEMSEFPFRFYTTTLKPASATAVKMEKQK
jgi:hypothetical protein